jgi:hypothetical protein
LLNAGQKQSVRPSVPVAEGGLRIGQDVRVPGLGGHNNIEDQNPLEENGQPSASEIKVLMGKSFLSSVEWAALTVRGSMKTTF